MKSVSILFSGRGSNAKSIIELILENKLNFKIKKVICNNLNSQGSKDIKNYNINFNIIDCKYYDNLTKYNLELKAQLSPEKNDYLLLCGYMKKIPESIINAYNGNVINIHPSILPKYKGLNTHEKVISNMDSHHGCTTHFVTNDIDCGPIIAQHIILVNDYDDASSIANKLLKFEHQLFYKTLKMIELGTLEYKNKKIYYNNKILTSPIIYD